MNIGFDLDKIFIDYPPLIPNWVIDKLYKKKSNGTLLYRIPGKLEQKFRILSHNPLLRPLIKNNFDFVKGLLQDKNNHLFLISSRFGFLKKRTEDLMAKHKFDTVFEKTLFNYNNQQPHLFKSTALKKNNIEIFIDDDLPLLRFLAKRHKNTHFFWLNKSTRGKIFENLSAITNLIQIKK